MLTLFILLLGGFLPVPKAGLEQATLRLPISCAINRAFGMIWHVFDLQWAAMMSSLYGCPPTSMENLSIAIQNNSCNHKQIAMLTNILQICKWNENITKRATKCVYVNKRKDIKVISHQHVKSRPSCVMIWPTVGRWIQTYSLSREWSFNTGSDGGAGWFVTI